jgi:hypothetical protein
MAHEKLRERHIDRLLSEEFESSMEFASWVCHQVFDHDIPDDAPSECRTTIGHYRLQGETDIRVETEWSTGEVAVLHVEDKLDAQPQPTQAERYTEAVVAENIPLSASVLIAPATWVRRHPVEAEIYNCVISLEDVADWLKVRASELIQLDAAYGFELANRLNWRADILNGDSYRRAVHEALRSGDLTDWNEAAAEVIQAKSGLVLEMKERQVTKDTSRQKKARFIRFAEPLRSKNKKPPILKLKTKNEKYPARVSLEVPKESHNSALWEKAQRIGYKVTTSGTTLIITKTSSKMGSLTIQKQISDQIEQTEAAAEVAQNLIEWWEKDGVDAT